MRNHHEILSLLIWSCASLRRGGPIGRPGAARAEDAGGLIPARLRCEARVDPLGIDGQQPRLDWLVESAQRGQKQTGYRILVASTAAALKEDRGDLWDTGQVNSDETTNIVYRGKPLTSHAYCHWKVKVWDKDGTPSPWSEPAVWSMGLLRPSDWTAQWIGSDAARHEEMPEAPFGAAQWIGSPRDRDLKAAKGHRLYLTEWRLPADVTVKTAELLVAGDDAYKFVINTTLVATGQGVPGRAQRVDVTPHIKAGVANSLRVEVENTAEGPSGLLATLIVTTTDGKALTRVTDGSWKSLDTPGANWHDRAIDVAAASAVRVLGDHGMAPWGKLHVAGLFLPPSPYLRTGFGVEKPVRRAVLYATALGLCDVYLNGRRVADDSFNPGWTDYAKRVYYRAYDVTDRIGPGANALGVILADGWYSGYVGFGGKRDHYGTKPRFLAQLHLEYADGTSADIATGPGWKAATGPIREADFLMGESYDARREIPGWDRPGFDDGTWHPVDVGADLQPVVQAHPGPPVVAIGEFHPRAITEPRPGVYVCDLGQNFAGVARLTVSGEPGQAISLRFAERLNPDGTIYTTNLRGARATDTYICRGRGPETWQPRFTFHGFQYVEVTGLPSRPTPETITGVALSSDTPVAGSFDCSEPMLNRLHSNIYWTQRSNFLDIPTDCPQRDERLGWTGDAQVYIRTATLNADVQAFFTKWLVDLEDGQRADGQFPMVAPVKVAGDDGGPAWADAGVICPWTLYDAYGDRRVLERHYDAMTRFVEFCRTRSTPDLLPPKQYHCFGDWLSVGADTPKDVIYTAYFAYSTRLTARAAEVLGKAEDAARYRALFEQIRAAFNRAYVADDGRIRGNTQACYVLALAFDLLDEGKAKLAAKYLVEDIEGRGEHLSTGFIGTKDLMLVLAKIGRNDVAYRLLENVSFPSWGFSITHGATSIWERWDGWTPEKGFQDPGMNSFAHYSFGAVYQWMVENIGGIRSAGPGYKKLLIAPQPGGRLTRAKTDYRSIHGRITTDWKREGETFFLDVTIPANTTATVSLPATRAADVTEGGRGLDQADGVTFVRQEGDRAILEVASGTYHFAAARKAPTSGSGD
jgi:alpha-L-rhamnosidase